jgi:hypothetical protein
MQKALTTVALILVCIAATSVAYYHIRYLPGVHDAQLAEQRHKTDLENAQRCNKDASKFYAEFRRDSLADSGRSWDGPETHFNRKLNTCLVEITWRDWTVSRIAGVGLQVFISQSVTDVYSNRELISTYYTVGERGEAKELDPMLGGMEPKKYSAEKDKLFGE